MDVLTLSRLQFAATISFHYIYPPLSIGLGVMLVIFEALWLKTRNPLYHQLARFTAIYLLLFAMFVCLLNDKIQHGPDDADLTPPGKLAFPFTA
jgi:cytochrome bd-type quinol oxidase subunit 1